MKKIYTLLISLLLLNTNIFATHNRAGEITYRQLSQYTYEITLVTYTYTPSAANEQRDQLEMQWGDDTFGDINRIGIDFLADEIQRNTYVGQHTFPGAGVYQIVMSDPNRNEGIENIPNSVTVMFSLKTTLKIDPSLGFNSTPILLNPPIDKAALNEIFIHNPSAYDPDGDSISYKMAVCLGDNALPIEGYMLPSASNSISINETTGDFIWDTPIQIGEYNVAIEIEEWRDGVKIGSIIRDMQIEVEETDNNPPVINPLANYCVTAGETISFEVTATDPNDDNITLSAYGGPFEVEISPATFPEVTHASPVSSTFTWNTHCQHIRQQAYSALFRAEDDNPEVSLTDYEESKITIVAPAPENLTASPSSNTAYLTWDTYFCTNATGFKIYRRKDSYNFSPSNCETGIPSYTGYTHISTVPGADKISFLDDNDGFGLVQGYTYCYRIIAYFEEGSESYASNEACVELIKGTPIFTETSVEHTHNEDGSIHLTWMKPTEFDNILYPGPYKYILESSADLYGQNYTNPIEIIGIEDTTYIDTIINTQDNPVSYKLTLFNNDGGEIEQIGTPGYTASIFLVGHPEDRKMRLEIKNNTPWTNYTYTIYRKDADLECVPSTEEYDSVGFTTSNIFVDYGLINDVNYMYKVKSYGEYDLDFIPKPLINYSQEICVSPQDTIPPCPVSLELNSNCDEFYNTLTWAINDTCTNDIDNFLIYYSNTYEGTLELIATIDDSGIRTFNHYPIETLAGCYVVAPQDSAGNSMPPEDLVKVCIDNCDYYTLPNVFTPNGDGINDLFIPFPYYFVEKIELTIYNRWGTVVFKTEDPDINWNGIDLETKKLVSDGVYYYICDVYEKRLTGVEIRNISGFVRIFGNNGNEIKE